MINGRSLTVARADGAIPRIENVPLTERARSAILEGILDKSFSHRLPSEEALAEMLNVSRTTIRTALQSLEQDGIVTRKRAIGTTINAHVRPSTLALQRMVGFDGLLREKGFDVEVEVEWERGVPGPELATPFELDPEQDSLIAEKSYFADGALAIYIRDLLPWANLRSQDFHGEVPASIFEFSTAEWERPVDHAVAEILPMVKPPRGTTNLRLKPDVPFTRLHERHFGSRGELLAASVVDVDNTFFHFEVFRRR
jgi:GntR family transcriptional regulator